MIFVPLFQECIFAHAILCGNYLYELFCIIPITYAKNICNKLTRAIAKLYHSKNIKTDLAEYMQYYSISWNYVSGHASHDYNNKINIGDCISITGLGNIWWVFYWLIWLLEYLQLLPNLNQKRHFMDKTFHSPVILH